MSIFEAQAPAIPTSSKSTNQKQWSVVIPVYEPDTFLKTALQSVISQNIPPGKMQIAVVDDASPTVDVQQLLERWGLDQWGNNRVEYYRNPVNLGPIANWNHCLDVAQGQWIHLLHQDDFVLPSFYQQLESGLVKEKAAGAAFCRHLYVDGEGHSTGASILENTVSGILPNCQDRLAEIQRIQFVSIVVQRSVYEVLGGFSPTAASASDWEMWQRIAAFYPIWYEPTPLAAFRLHDQSETSQLLRQGGNIADSRLAIATASQYLVPPMRLPMKQIAHKHYGISAMEKAADFLQVGDLEAALAQIREGLQCSTSEAVVQKLRQTLDSFHLPEIDSKFKLGGVSGISPEESFSQEVGDEEWRSLLKRLKRINTNEEPHTFRAIRLRVLQLFVETSYGDGAGLDRTLGQLIQELTCQSSHTIDPSEMEKAWIQYAQNNPNHHLTSGDHPVWQSQLVNLLYADPASYPREDVKKLIDILINPENDKMLFSEKKLGSLKKIGQSSPIIF